VKPEFFFAPGDWFDTIAEPDDDDDEDGTGNSVIITDSHTFLDPSPDPAYGFIKLQIADRTGKITIEEVGDPEFEAVNVMGEGIHPGWNPLLASYFGKNFNGIVLMQDSSCSANMYYQIGAVCALARKEGWKYETGLSGGGDKKGFTLKFASYQDKVRVYTGAITLAEQPAS
jgi:hypothetical protein